MPSLVGISLQATEWARHTSIPTQPCPPTRSLHQLGRTETGTQPHSSGPRLALTRLTGCPLKPQFSPYLRVELNSLPNTKSKEGLLLCEDPKDSQGLHFLCPGSRSPHHTSFHCSHTFQVPESDCSRAGGGRGRTIGWEGQLEVTYRPEHSGHTPNT